MKKYTTRSSQRRRFIMRFPQPVTAVKGGIRMDIPPDISPPTALREPESIAAIVCPRCDLRWYVTRPFLDMIDKARSIADSVEPGLAKSVTPRHQPCQTPMRVLPLSPEE